MKLRTALGLLFLMSTGYFVLFVLSAQRPSPMASVQADPQVAEADREYGMRIALAEVNTRGTSTMVVVTHRSKPQLQTTVLAGEVVPNGTLPKACPR